MAVLTVIGLFLVRIGIPLVALIALGTLIDRHQTKKRAEAQKIYKLERQVDETKAKKAA